MKFDISNNLLILVINLFQVRHHFDNIWYSVRPKPLFWFTSDTDTETQFGWYFWANMQYCNRYRNQISGENPVNNFFHHQMTPKTKFVAKYEIFLDFFFNLIKIYITPTSGKTWHKFEFLWIFLTKKVSVSERKEKFWLRYRYRNWTLVLVPDTET